MRIFLDANILFSAANEASNMHRLLVMAAKQEMLYISPHIKDEAERNLERKQPRWLPTFYTLLQDISVVPDCPLYARVKLAEHDHPVLGAAIAAACDYLVTGDKRDFGHLFGKTIDGVKIVDYLTVADIILARFH